MASRLRSLSASILLLTLLFTATAGRCETATVKAGLFVTQLGDFDMARRSLSATFWTWFLHTDPDYDPLATAEVVNAKVDTVKFPSLDTSRGMKWHQAKHAAVLAQDWDITHFPFDRQTLTIVIEDGQQDADHVRFTADSANSGVDPSVSVPGWTIESFRIDARDRTYNTSYGDPLLQGDSHYSQILATITVKREGLRLLCSLFVGFAVAFLLAMLSFFLSFGDMAGTRISLCAAGIFATVGNKYALDNVLPPSPTFTLADVIVSSSFLSVLMAALAVVLIQLFHRKHPRLAFGLNAGMALVTAAGVIGVNAYAILRAMA